MLNMSRRWLVLAVWAAINETNLKKIVEFLNVSK